MRVELALLARGDRGVHTPLRDGGRGEWPDGAFGGDVRKPRGVRARLVALAALEADKSADHGDPAAATKDRADVGIAGDRPVLRFPVRDVDALSAEVGSLPDRTPVTDTSWGTREFHVRDADGNGLQFSQDL